MKFCYSWTMVLNVSRMQIMNLPRLCVASTSHYNPLLLSVRCIKHHVVSTTDHKQKQSSKHRHEPSTQNVRNIGLVAHIDAGKTTTTERMLYVSGATRAMGNVDSGDTVTDYMQQERSRGITINSAVVNFDWRSHRIHLIDTPGHVDFTVEVERSVRVLDGAVVVLDGSAGVQAQTMTVWEQCRRYGVPAIAFLNKMDKPRYNYDQSLSSIESHLQMPALPLQPANGQLSLLQTPNLDRALDQNKEFVDKFVDKLADLDDEFAECLLKHEGKLEKLDVQQYVLPAVRRVTLSRRAMPVCVGSSLHSQGVTHLLDAIVALLPSPEDRQHLSSAFYPSDSLCALAFKTEHDPRLGPLTYARVYSGSIPRGSHFYNVNAKVTETAHEVYVPQADELVQVKRAHAGDICILSGLKHTRTGDSLVETEKIAKQAAATFMASQQREVDGTAVGEQLSVIHDGLALTGITAPEPVFFCSIEAERLSEQAKLDKALLVGLLSTGFGKTCVADVTSSQLLIAELSMDDPSMRIRQDTDQVILETQGELHVEVIRARLQDEWNLNVFLGPLQVSYKELPLDSAQHNHKMTETQDGRTLHCELSLAIAPKAEPTTFKHVILDQSPTADPNLHKLRRDWQMAIDKGCVLALSQGPMLGGQVMNVDITLSHIDASGRVSPALVSACASHCVSEMLKGTKMGLLEPIMFVELRMNEHSVGFEPLITELGLRRAQLQEANVPSETASSSASTQFMGIRAFVPLSELVGWAAAVRRISSGTVALHMHKHGYMQLDAHVHDAVLKKLGLNT